MAGWASLDRDLLCLIAARLPGPAVGAAESVCKNWRGVLTSEPEVYLRLLSGVAPDEAKQLVQDQKTKKEREQAKEKKKKADTGGAGPSADAAASPAAAPKKGGRGKKQGEMTLAEKPAAAAAGGKRRRSGGQADEDAAFDDLVDDDFKKRYIERYLFAKSTGTKRCSVCYTETKNAGIAVFKVRLCSLCTATGVQNKSSAMESFGLTAGDLAALCGWSDGQAMAIGSNVFVVTNYLVRDLERAAIRKYGSRAQMQAVLAARATKSSAKKEAKQNAGAEIEKELKTRWAPLDLSRYSPAHWKLSDKIQADLAVVMGNVPPKSVKRRLSEAGLPVPTRRKPPAWEAIVADIDRHLLQSKHRERLDKAIRQELENSYKPAAKRAKPSKPAKKRADEDDEEDDDELTIEFVLAAFQAIKARDARRTAGDGNDDEAEEEDEEEGREDAESDDDRQVRATAKAMLVRVPYSRMTDSALLSVDALPLFERAAALYESELEAAMRPAVLAAVVEGSKGKGKQSAAAGKGKKRKAADGDDEETGAAPPSAAAAKPAAAAATEAEFRSLAVRIVALLRQGGDKNAAAAQARQRQAEARCAAAQAAHEREDRIARAQQARAKRLQAALAARVSDTLAEAMAECGSLIDEPLEDLPECVMQYLDADEAAAANGTLAPPEPPAEAGRKKDGKSRAPASAKKVAKAAVDAELEAPVAALLEMLEARRAGLLAWFSGPDQPLPHGPGKAEAVELLAATRTFAKLVASLSMSLPDLIEYVEADRWGSSAFTSKLLAGPAESSSTNAAQMHREIKKSHGLFKLLRVFEAERQRGQRTLELEAALKAAPVKAALGLMPLDRKAEKALREWLELCDSDRLGAFLSFEKAFLPLKAYGLLQHKLSNAARECLPACAAVTARLESLRGGGGAGSHCRQSLHEAVALMYAHNAVGCEAASMLQGQTQEGRNDPGASRSQSGWVTTELRQKWAALSVQAAAGEMAAAASREAALRTAIGGMLDIDACCWFVQEQYDAFCCTGEAKALLPQGAPATAGVGAGAKPAAKKPKRGAAAEAGSAAGPSGAAAGVLLTLQPSSDAAAVAATLKRMEARSAARKAALESALKAAGLPPPNLELEPLGRFDWDHNYVELEAKAMCFVKDDSAEAMPCSADPASDRTLSGAEATLLQKIVDAYKTTAAENENACMLEARVSDVEKRLLAEPAWKKGEYWAKEMAKQQCEQYTAYVREVDAGKKYTEQQIVDAMLKFVTAEGAKVTYSVMHAGRVQNLRGCAQDRQAAGASGAGGAAYAGLPMDDEGEEEDEDDAYLSGDEIDMEYYEDEEDY